MDREKRLKSTTDLIELFRLSGSSNARDLLEKLYKNKYEEVLHWGNKSDVNDDLMSPGDEFNHIHTDLVPMIQRKVGEALGYSPFQIWRRLHPVLTAMSGIAASVIASGAGYLAYQYLSK